MRKSQWFVGVVMLLFVWIGCEQSSSPAPNAPQALGRMVKQAELRAYLEGMIESIAEDRRTVDSGLLEDLAEGSVLVNRAPAFASIDPYITIEETGKKYRIVLSRFVGSTTDDDAKVVFALDPDRFAPNGISLSGHTMVASGLYTTGPTGEVVDLGGLTPQTKVPYRLIFIDIKRYMSREEVRDVQNKMIAQSKIYQEMGVKEVGSQACLECEDEGGGAGGTAPLRPYLVLKYIKLKTDNDGGDDECELYLRESAAPNVYAEPGGGVNGWTSHILSGDYRNDMAGRWRWYPNLNNAGDEATADIALWPLSDTYSVSFVFIEDDDDEGQFDWGNGRGPYTMSFLMNSEYVWNTQSVAYDRWRDFTVAEYHEFPFLDSDDIWTRSHFANFTASNLPDSTLITIELTDFKVQVMKVFL